MEMRRGDKAINLPFQGGLPALSPFYNAAARFNLDAADVLAEMVRNRIGYALVIVVIAALSFGRAEQRERVLGG